MLARRYAGKLNPTKSARVNTERGNSRLVPTNFGFFPLHAPMTRRCAATICVTMFRTMPNMRVALLLLTLLTLTFIRSILWKVSLRTTNTHQSDTTVSPPLVLGTKKTTSTTPVIHLFTIPTDEWHQPPGLAPWQETDKPLCTREQIRNGTWVPVMLDEAPYVTTTTHLRCYPKEYFQQKPFPSYKWQPADPSCDFSKFRYEMMCRLLVDTSVMIVGDSLVSID